jgi:hypothetical protein
MSKDKDQTTFVVLNDVEIFYASTSYAHKNQDSGKYQFSVALGLSEANIAALTAAGVTATVVNPSTGDKMPRYRPIHNKQKEEIAAKGITFKRVAKVNGQPATADNISDADNQIIVRTSSGSLVEQELGNGSRGNVTILLPTVKGKVTPYIGSIELTSFVPRATNTNSKASSEELEALMQQASAAMRG